PGLIPRVGAVEWPSAGMIAFTCHDVDARLVGWPSPLRLRAPSDCDHRFRLILRQQLLEKPPRPRGTQSCVSLCLPLAPSLALLVRFRFALTGKAARRQ